MAEARKLARSVYVDGALLEEGSTPTPAQAKQITNPRAWGDNPDDVDATSDDDARGDDTPDIPNAVTSGGSNAAAGAELARAAQKATGAKASRG